MCDRKRFHVPDQLRLSVTPRGHTYGMAAHHSDLQVSPNAVAEKGEQYVAVVEALVASPERFRLQLRPGEVAADVRAGGTDLDQNQVSLLLEQLANWGNVSRFYD